MKPRLPYNAGVAVAHLRKVDPRLWELIDRVGPFALAMQPADSLFEALLRSIIYQQLHGRAAATIHDRVLQTLRPHGGATPGSVAKISDALLRGAGLSQNKLLAVRDLAEHCLVGTVPTLAAARKLSDYELGERLTMVRGIGPWTVHMFQIFTLGRPDIMPTGDFAIRLAFQRLYRKRSEPSPAQIIRHARVWQPWRSVASWYLWRSLAPETT